MMASHIYLNGICIAGEACKFPNLWVRLEDKFPSCKNIVHPLCGNVSFEGDSYRCGPCHEKTTLTSMNPVTTEIESKSRDPHYYIIYTVTESTDTSSFKSIQKDFFITSEQHHNVVTNDRDGTMRRMLRSAVCSEIDKDLKAMMILRSQEGGLKVKTDDTEKIFSCWSDIGIACRNDDSVDTSKNVSEIVLATFEDHSGYEFYMRKK